MWKTKAEAWWQGFLDGLHYTLDREVLSHHAEYEQGLITGLVDRRHLDRTAKQKELKDGTRP